MSSEDSPKTSKRLGCFKWLGILVLLFALVKGCNAYQNRPSALYERWLGTPVPGDVTDLKGGYQFYLTESVAWLSFKAPSERVIAIVEKNGMQRLNGGPYLENVEDDTEVYFVGLTPEDDLQGWLLYYKPASHEVSYNLSTF